MLLTVLLMAGTSAVIGLAPTAATIGVWAAVLLIAMRVIQGLALGADGVAMGTRFLVADEIWAHPRYKERVMSADETTTTVLLQSLMQHRHASAYQH